MDEILLVLEGSCKGSRPVECDIEELTSEEWYEPLLDLITEKKIDAAEQLAREWINSEFNFENLERLDELGFRYVKTLSSQVKVPFVEEVDGVKIPLFRWIGAEFVVSAPVHVVKEWLSNDGAGRLILDDDKLSEWLEANDSRLQDGCIYRVGSIWYDLEGFGENGCSINKPRLEEVVNSQIQSHPGNSESKMEMINKLSGENLLAKIKEMEGAPKDDIVRACGYVLLGKNGKERLDHSSFFEAHMKAKGVFT